MCASDGYRRRSLWKRWWPLAALTERAQPVGARHVRPPRQPIAAPESSLVCGPRRLAAATLAQQTRAQPAATARQHSVRSVHRLAPRAPPPPATRPPTLSVGCTKTMPLCTWRRRSCAQRTNGWDSAVAKADAATAHTLRAPRPDPDSWVAWVAMAMEADMPARTRRCGTRLECSDSTTTGEKYGAAAEDATPLARGPSSKVSPAWITPLCQHTQHTACQPQPQHTQRAAGDIPVNCPRHHHANAADVEAVGDVELSRYVDSFPPLLAWRQQAQVSSQQGQPVK